MIPRGRLLTRGAAAPRRTAAIDTIHKPCHKYDKRPAGVLPDLIVIHFSATRTVEEIFDIFHRGPAQVSSHYVIDDDGTIFRLVSETKRAWHAGRSSFLGRKDVNSRSIGIELRNGGRLTPAGDGVRFRTVQGRLYRPKNQALLAEGHWWESYADDQMEALGLLCREISRRHGMSQDRLVGHSQIATPQGRKIDPGPLFDWGRLRLEADPSLSS